MPLKRTGVTSLSDDELLLLDVLFEQRPEVGFLRRDDFGVMFNRKHTHGLSDAELLDTVRNFRTRGIVGVREYGCLGWDARPWLTPVGGQMWEAERAPRWELYCEGNGIGPYPGKEIEVLIRSPGRSAAYAYLKAFVVVGFYRRVFDLSEQQHSQFPLLEWKVFPTVHEIRGYGVIADFPFDLRPLERVRSWWNNVPELQRFL